MYQKQLLEKEQRDAVMTSSTWRIVESPTPCIWINTHGYKDAGLLLAAYFKGTVTGFSILSQRIEKDENKKDEFLVIELKDDLNQPFSDSAALYPLFVKRRLGPQIFSDKWALTERGYYECKVTSIGLYRNAETLKVLSDMGIGRYLVSKHGVPDGGRVYACIYPRPSYALHLRWHKCKEDRKYRFIAAWMRPYPCMDCPQAEVYYEKWNVLEEE